jgi:hypothetical protein
MRRFVVFVVLVTACGGQQIPMHNGYKTDKAKPWKKAKSLKFDDKLEAKSEGDLSYPDMRRAAWFDITLPSVSNLDLRVEITPPGEATNENFDLGVEVLDSGFRPVLRKDLEEGDQQGEINKTLSLKDQPAGHYLVHLYLQGRLDTCDYVLHAQVKPSAPTAVKSDFPAQVAFIGALPMVPINDDTPKSYKPVTPVVVTHTTNHHTTVHQPKPPDPPPAATTINARILGVSVVSGGTQITIGAGTGRGAHVGMSGKVNGIAGSFSLAACNERSCTATVNATPDQLNRAGSVTLGP